MGELIAYAVEGLATILDRATAEAGVAAPEVTLTPATLLATLAVPRKLVVKRLAGMAERRLVESMYDELAATGRVEASLPRTSVPCARFTSARSPDRAASSARAALAALAGAGPHGGRTSRASGRTRDRRGPARGVRRPRAGASPPPPLPRTPAPADVANLAARREAEAPRVHLRADDDLEAAPSIGPRLAERLGRLGLKTVADLLADDPARIARSSASATSRRRRCAAGGTRRGW